MQVKVKNMLHSLLKKVNLYFGKEVEIYTVNILRKKIILLYIFDAAKVMTINKLTILNNPKFWKHFGLLI